MPSETIYSRDGVNVRVSWGTNQSGEVQVATVAARNGSDGYKRLTDMINEWLRESGRIEIDWDAVAADLPDKPSFGGWYAQLEDWGELNRLIKVLKRARDQAFGNPE